MKARKAVVAGLVAVMSGAFWMQAPSASASCYPQKPQTCARCEIGAIWVDESGNVHVDWVCY